MILHKALGTDATGTGARVPAFHLDASLCGWAVIRSATLGLASVSGGRVAKIAILTRAKGLVLAVYCAIRIGSTGRGVTGIRGCGSNWLTAEDRVACEAHLAGAEFLLVDNRADGILTAGAS